MLASLNGHQRKHIAKILGDIGKLIYLGSTATPLFGEDFHPALIVVGFLVASTAVWFSIKLLE